MTPVEFKAWFDGFVEGMDGKPTEKQWARVKERVAEIDGQTTTQTHYVDRYWPSVRTYYPYPAQWQYCNSSLGMQGASQSQATRLTNGYANQVVSFDSLQAMHSLGRADKASLG